tara:strand:- start:95 stop:988 length:894 start_codon:yes stop_codon:yes gene_type:complete
MRSLVRQWTGIPVRIGIAPNKTLSKIAVSEIKRRNIPTSVLHLSDKNQIRDALKKTPINKVWGVGRKLTNHLNANGINTALELSEINPQSIRKNFSIVLERTVRELKGERCLNIENNTSSKKQILVSRSFGNKISNLESLKPIVSNFAVRAAEKLRHEKQKCSQVSIFIRTSPFNKNQPQYSGIKTIELFTPTNDTRDILKAIKKGLLLIFKPGYNYAKAGIILNKFSNEQIKQYSLLKDPDKPKDNTKFMKYIDKMNTYENQIYFASQNTKRWSPMKQNMTSPKYTTNWYELPKVN